MINKNSPTFFFYPCILPFILKYFYKVIFQKKSHFFNAIIHQGSQKKKYINQNQATTSKVK